MRLWHCVDSVVSSQLSSRSGRVKSILSFCLSFQYSTSMATYAGHVLLIFFVTMKRGTS